jgi:hypothetical protein
MLLAQITGGTTPDHLCPHCQFGIADTQAEHNLMRQHTQRFRRVVITPYHWADVGASLAGKASAKGVVADVFGFA